MVRVSIHQLKPGMVLAAPLKTPEGTVLLNAGVVLKAAYIQRLKELGFTGAYVRDGVADDLVPYQPISEQTRQMAMASVRQVFQELHREDRLPDLQQVRQAVHRMLDDLLSQPGVMAGLSQIRSADDYTFAHSVDVAVLSLLAGLALGYNRPRLVDLGMGALLHDIGKIRVRRDILTKPSSLSPEEMEEMRLHTVYGFEMLRGRSDVSAVSAHVAYQHHERNDGSGYPRGLREKEIHPLAQVVAVADVFDAMTSDRPYRRGLPVHVAASFLGRESGRLFNAMVVERFLSRVPLFPTGTTVRLTTGEIAVVVSQNPQDRRRPVVRLLAGRDGKVLRRPVEIDLLRDRERAIEGVQPWAPPGEPP